MHIINRPRWVNGPFTRYAKLWVAHAPGMPGTFSPPPRISDSDMHHGTCEVGRWGKRSRHSRRMRNPQFYVSGKRPMNGIADQLECQDNNIRHLDDPSPRLILVPCWKINTAHVRELLVNLPGFKILKSGQTDWHLTDFDLLMKEFEFGFKSHRNFGPWGVPTWQLILRAISILNNFDSTNRPSFMSITLTELNVLSLISSFISHCT